MHERDTPLTASQMNQFRCTEPGCRTPDHPELIFHSTCHPDIPTWATYEKASRTLRISCAACDHVIMRILVAQEGAP